jgi:hypothetical protein
MATIRQLRTTAERAKANARRARQAREDAWRKYNLMVDNRLFISRINRDVIQKNPEIPEGVKFFFNVFADLKYEAAELLRLEWERLSAVYEAARQAAMKAVNEYNDRLVDIFRGGGELQPLMPYDW